MIYLINCEHDDKGGFILLVELTDAEKCCLMQLQECVRKLQHDLREAGGTWGFHNVAYGIDFQGHYVCAGDEATEPLEKTLPRMDVEKLLARLEDKDAVCLDTQHRLEHATGKAYLRTLQVAPNGDLAMAGTIDDEHVSGVGTVCGPTIVTVRFDLPGVSL
jgi:hypothetical protein